MKPIRLSPRQRMVERIETGLRKADRRLEERHRKGDAREARADARMRRRMERKSCRSEAHPVTTPPKRRRKLGSGWAAMQRAEALRGSA